MVSPDGHRKSKVSAAIEKIKPRRTSPPGPSSCRALSRCAFHSTLKTSRLKTSRGRAPLAASLVAKGDERVNLRGAARGDVAGERGDRDEEQRDDGERQRVCGRDAVEQARHEAR